MRVASGAHLGPYEVLDRLGAGGMGEVYRARDTRLGRTVALKVLSSRWAEDAAVRRRFLREARAVSSISHPHICALYDIGSDGDIDYLVMEHLEGETLAQRLTRGPLDVGEALAHGIEIASALEHAHRSGIVHRDLKAGNIMLTKSGAKLLDFGLARLAEPGTSIIEPITTDGVFLGTLDYTAPEQINGADVDARADIFSFGIILYEMLTAKRPFAGETRASVIGSILFAEPGPLAEKRNDVPLALERLIDACLRKDPAERIQTAHDLRLQLEWLRSESGRTEASRVRRKPKPAKAKMLGAALLSVVVLLAAVATAWSGRRFFQQEPPRARFELTSPNAAEEMTWAVISPDGKHLAFTTETSDGRGALWVRDLDSTDARRLPGTEGAALPFWSPDSTAIAFFASQRLKVLPLQADTPQILAEATAPRGGTWGRKGTILFTPDIALPIQSVSSLGGAQQAVTTMAKGDSTHRWPEFLPDGDHFTFVIGSADPERSGVYLGSLETGEVHRISRSTNRALFLDDMFLFVQDGKLFRQNADAGRGTVESDATLLADEVSVDAKLTGAAAFSASAGVLTYLTVPAPRHEFVWFDRAGNRVGSLPVPPGQYVNPRLAPDDSALAVTRVDPASGKDSIWTIDTRTGSATHLVLNDANSDGALWSPDARTIYFTDDRRGRYDIYRKPADASAPEERIYEARGFAQALSAQADSVLIADRLTGETRVFLLDLRTRRQRELAVAGDTGETVMSRDGKWLTFKSQRVVSGRAHEIFIQSVDNPDLKLQITDGGGAQPWFATDSKEVYYVDPNRRLMAVAFTPPRPGRPQPLFRVNIANFDYASADYCPTTDRQRFLVNTRVDTGEHAHTTVMLNWRAD